MMRQYRFFTNPISLPRSLSFSCALTFTLFLGLFLSNLAHGEPLNSIMAYVNKDVITSQQFNQAFQMTKAELTSNHQPIPTDAALKKQVLDHLIDQSLQVQKAKDAGIVVTDQMLEQALKHLAEQNHLSRADMQATIEKQGFSFSEYQNMLKQQIMTNKLLQQAVGKDVSISPQEVTHFLQNFTAANTAYQYHVVDYLIPLPEHPSATQKQKALSLVKQLSTELHKKTGTEANVKNIQTVVETDLGTRPLEQLPALFATAIQALTNGGITAPITAPNGIHVLVLAEKSAVHQTVQLPTRAEAEQMLYVKKLDEAAKQFTKQLRQGAYVKIMA